MNDFHFLSQESCMTGAFACFQSGLRTCFAITYTYITKWANIPQRPPSLTHKGLGLCAPQSRRAADFLDAAYTSSRRVLCCKKLKFATA